MDDDKSIVDKITENLFSIVPIMAKSYSRAVRTKTDFTPATLFTLAALAHHGKLTMTGIGNHLMVPKSHVTVLVDKLIADNLAERHFDETDRRIINIKLTQKGLETFLATKKIIGADFREQLEKLPTSDLELMLESSSFVKKILLEIIKDLNLQNTECKNQ